MRLTPRNPLINPPQHGSWIILSKRQRIIAFYKDGKQLRTITNFSIGGVHQGVMHATPSGKFKVLNKDEHHVSHSYKTKSGAWAPMPLYVQFFRAGGFHVGDPKAASHGCVHLTREDAQFIFNTAEVGKTHVWVTPH
jgi:lipoprotein-anchoring transpeptidase ErfK/SrfK